MTYTELYSIILSIEKSLVFDYENSWDWKSFLAAISYICKSCPIEEMKNKLYVLIRIDRDVEKYHENNKSNRKPESTGIKSEQKIAKSISIYSPTIILLRQNGSVEKGWKGQPFYWPVLYSPSKMKPLIYSEEISS